MRSNSISASTAWRWACRLRSSPPAGHLDPDRKTIRIGWMTLLLALFIGLDIATFWDAARLTFRDAPFSYGMLVIGLAIALLYFVAASLVFPHQITEGMDLDDHFWASKKVVLLLTVVANLLMVIVAVTQILGQPRAVEIISTYVVTLAFYVALVVPAALTHSKRVFGVLIGLHVLIYLIIACMPLLLQANHPDVTPAPAAAT